MSRYELCLGIAMNPIHQETFLSSQSLKGWHITGFSKGQFFYEFEQGKPERFTYSVLYTTPFNEEFQYLLSESGWSIVASSKQCQILRSSHDAAPIFTDSFSRYEVFRELRNQYGRYTLTGFLIGFILAAVSASFAIIFSIPLVSFVMLLLAVAVMATSIVFGVVWVRSSFQCASLKSL